MNEVDASKFFAIDSQFAYFRISKVYIHGLTMLQPRWVFFCLCNSYASFYGVENCSFGFAHPTPKIIGGNYCLISICLKTVVLCKGHVFLTLKLCPGLYYCDLEFQISIVLIE